MFSPKRVKTTEIPSFWKSLPARRADSESSPGMKRRTARLAKRSRGRWYRSHLFDAIHKKIRRIPYLGQSLNRGRDRYLMSFLTTRTNRASLSPHVGSRRARASD